MVFLFVVLILEVNMVLLKYRVGGKMLYCFLIVAFAAILLVFYLKAKINKYDLKELYLKTVISVLFIVLALVATLESAKFGEFNVLVIAGLLFGLIGDILLDLKYVDIERTEGYSYGGFIAFGIGHILYLSGLIISFLPKGKAWFLILALVLDIIMACMTIILEKPMKLQYGKMKKISFAYALCLFGTLSVSFFLAIANGFSIMPLNLFLIGSVLFVISDLVLSGTYFGEGKERPIDFILNYLTYYGAQFLFAFLLLFL